MFKKKNKEVSTRQDIFVKNYQERRCEALIELRERTEKVIIRSGVVNLYPEGADKDKAIKDLEQAKTLLLCAIGRYDSTGRDLNEALESQEPRITTLHYGKAWKTSHEVIEEVYKEFYKKA